MWVKMWKWAVAAGEQVGRGKAAGKDVASRLCRGWGWANGS